MSTEAHQARLLPEGDEVAVDLPDADAARAFYRGAARQGAVLLSLAAEPATLPTYICRLVVAGADSGFTFPARAVQIFPGAAGGIRAVFQPTESLSGRLPELDGKIRSAESARAAEEESSEEAESGGESFEAEAEAEIGGEGREEAREAPKGETRGVSPIFRIKEMNPNQKMRLAMQAGRVERQILRRDNSPQVMMGLLGNPRAESDDVLAIVKSPNANAAILKRVADDPRWSAAADIRLALVRNPKTPSLLAIKLLDSLPTSQLRPMAKMGALRENVRKAALRLYLKRIGKP